jgi:hypothetical protein
MEDISDTATVPHWTFAMRERIPAGHVNQLDPPPWADGSSSLTAIPLVLCVWKAEGVTEQNQTSNRDGTENKRSRW